MRRKLLLGPILSQRGGIMYIERELPDNLDDCHKRIVTLEDAVQREVEGRWNLQNTLREKYEEKHVEKNRHKAMVNRLLLQMPREWIRKFIYDNDLFYTVIKRSNMHREYDGEY